METLSINEKLKSIAVKDTTWREKAIWRQENREWLDRAAKIAVKILSTLRTNRSEGKSPSTQKELAEILNVTPQQVNKIVKGGENLTLETITRLEIALGVNLMVRNNLANYKTASITTESVRPPLSNEKVYTPSLVSQDKIMPYVSVAGEVLQREESFQGNTEAGEYSYAMAA